MSDLVNHGILTLGSPNSIVGSIQLYAGSEVSDSHWMVCDGSPQSKSAYPELFDTIGYTYGGSGDVFNLPNLQGMCIIGYSPNDSDFNVLGKTGGEKTVTLSVSQMPSHTHIQNSHSHSSTPHTHNIDKHTHSLSSHTHTFTTGTQSANHTHSISITSGGNSVNHTHTWSGTTSNASVSNLVNPTGGNQYILPDGSGGYSRPFNVINGNEAGIVTTSQSHNHTVSGTTSANNTGHVHAVKGTSAANSANHTHSGTTASAKPELTGSTVITADGTTVSISDSVAVNQNTGGGSSSFKSSSVYGSQLHYKSKVTMYM